MALHRAGQADAERLRGKLQRQLQTLLKTGGKMGLGSPFSGSLQVATLYGYIDGRVSDT